MKRVTMDELKEYFPGEDESALVEQAKAEGIEVDLQGKEVAKQEEVHEEEKQEEVAEEQTEEDTDNDDDLVDERTKKGLIAARQKEREKRRAVEAEKNAEIDRLTKQLEELSKQRVAQPQQQQQFQAEPQQQAQAIEQPGYYDSLMDAASEKARKEAGIAKDISDEDLMAMQFTEPRKYNKYVLAMNTIAQELHQENVKFAQAKNDNVQFEREISVEPQYQAIFNYAKDMLDDMPMREARKIDEAAYAFGQHRASKEQLATLREYWAKAKEGFTGARAPAQRQQQPATPPPSKLDAFAHQPRSQEVRGSQSSSISEAELLRMFDDDPVGALDKVPKATLDRYRRG